MTDRKINVTFDTNKLCSVLQYYSLKCDSKSFQIFETMWWPVQQTRNKIHFPHCKTQQCKILLGTFGCIILILIMWQIWNTRIFLTENFFYFLSASTFMVQANSSIGQLNLHLLHPVCKFLNIMQLKSVKLGKATECFKCVLVSPPGRGHWGSRGGVWRLCVAGERTSSFYWSSGRIQAAAGSRVSLSN